MTAGRTITAVLLAAAAAGCAGDVGFVNLPVARNCPPPTRAEDFENVEWDKVRQIDVRIRDGEFQPSIVRLHQGNGYIFRLNNRDDKERRFLAPKFFSKLKIESIVVGENVIVDSCVAGLAVPPLTVAQIRFIVERDGRYEFEDTAFPLPFAGVPSGLIVVEQAQPRIETVQVLPAPSAIPVFKPKEDEGGTDATSGATGATPASAPGAAAPGAQPAAPADSAPTIQTIRRQAPTPEVLDKPPPPVAPAPATKPAEGGGLFGQ